ncbi:MAG: DUF4960 domain-containing protein [Prevotella sp.]|nr:DUF4960 domain-containing protein [Prevotella sp.]
MTTKILNTLAALCFICSFASCNDDNSGSMDVGGDCRVEKFVLNNAYEGAVDMANRLIKVKVPVDFNTKNDMQVTSLTIHAGAKSNINVGDHLNLESDKSLHITSGSLVMDYRIAVRNDEAKLTNFVLAGIKGAINEETKTVTVAVLATSGIDLSSATFEVTCSEDASCFPASGSTGDFSDPANPLQITLTDNTAVSTYTVMIDLIQRPTAVFAGSAETADGLNDEERAAAKWLTSNIQGAAYLSWHDIANSEGILDECKFIFFHRQASAYNSLKNFKDGEPGAMEALPVLKEYWKRGGALVLQRMGVDLAAALGAMPEEGCPNNCWGGTGEGGPQMGDDPWTLPVFDKSHALWQGLTANPNNPEAVYTLDKDYTICNSASQYHWDGVSDDALYAKFDEVTGGKARRLTGHGNEISSWELKNFNGEFGRGGIICFGAGLLDWYSPTDYVSVYHENMGTILMNAYHYLTGE